MRSSYLQFCIWAIENGFLKEPINPLIEKYPWSFHMRIHYMWAQCFGPITRITRSYNYTNLTWKSLSKRFTIFTILTVGQKKFIMTNAFNVRSGTNWCIRQRNFGAYHVDCLSKCILKTCRHSRSQPY
jgi:hypothetical protein